MFVHIYSSFTIIFFHKMVKVVMKRYKVFSSSFCIFLICVVHEYKNVKESL
jgi:hypothetical protein